MGESLYFTLQFVVVIILDINNWNITLTVAKDPFYSTDLCKDWSQGIGRREKKRRQSDRWRTGPHEPASSVLPEFPQKIKSCRKLLVVQTGQTMEAMKPACTKLMGNCSQWLHLSCRAGTEAEMGRRRVSGPIGGREVLQNKCNQKTNQTFWNSLSMPPCQ